jgi:GR25 family glycosyltransferase involved in LPS biosynthesis
MKEASDSMNWKSYVINIDESTERLAHFKALNIRFRRDFLKVSAVTPKNSDLSQVKFVSESVAACWHSHLKVFSSFLNSDYEFAFIQEDDSLLKELDLNNYINFMKVHHIDFLQIGFLYGTIGRRLEIFGKNFLHIFLLVIKIFTRPFKFLSWVGKKPLVKEIFLSSPWLVPADVRAGTHAYIVSRHFANNVKDLNDPIFLAADDFYIALSRMRSFSMYRLLRSKAKQGPWKSTISPNLTPKNYS